MGDVFSCTAVRDMTGANATRAQAVSVLVLSRPVAILVLTGAIGGIVLCLALLVFSLVILCRRKRNSSITPYEVGPMAERSRSPRVIHKPPPQAPSSTPSTNTGTAKRAPTKPDFTLHPFTLRSPPSNATMTSHQRTHPSRDSLQFKRPRSSSKDSDDFTQNFQSDLHRRSSVDPVVALELGERGSPDRRSLEARPSSSTDAEERMLAKVERFRELPLSQWNAGSSLLR